MSRPRRDPRAERQSHDVGATGSRPRYDRSQPLPGRAGVPPIVAPARSGMTTQPQPAKPELRIVDEPAFLVFAVVEAPGGRLSRFDRQVLGAARLLADAGDGGAGVVAIASHSVEGLGEAGADRVLLFTAEAMPGTVAKALRQTVDALSPRHVLFAETGDSADLARRLAIALDEPLLANVEHLTSRQAVRAIRNGRAEIAATPPRLISLGEDRIKPYEAAPCEARALALDTAPHNDDPAILSVEFIPGDPASLALSETDFVVSAGNGVSDFAAFRDLATHLRATPGASRVVCDAGLMPRAAQVGASGTVLSADCYFALGISGAPQHLQGIAGCEHVIAVNTDLHAAMIERAGLAIVQDAQLVMPALLQLLRGGER
ncbi:electron transfer flavoprotein subunit alpha/FixB family protein [Jiella sp. MQZ9-1]|uniref:Electron transfer flavoprotein subunit alpha/FixB family protein n=1 Tax=Jiella flava TaxID=2816857 RepID=A0A939G2W3_9HYPH|nr:electron transfer flavoprotein subunit alpha/FixB family protein [Jiella flava]MBO0664232.1 electron transfer flavoprotein subunit alpha/FixB family protein [Jiella flava]MCD2472878.1 electron transfer flavoprotein subunit alpha/FixB family protein [Jiella flava]